MLSKLFSSKSQESAIEWRKLTATNELLEVEEISKTTPVLIFKHSVRCGISAMAINRFERDYTETASFVPYYLDLINYRDVSNEVAERYGVLHESPQTVLMVDGKVVHTSSHNGIDFKEINEVAKNK